MVSVCASCGAGAARWMSRCWTRTSCDHASPHCHLRAAVPRLRQAAADAASEAVCRLLGARAGAVINAKGEGSVRVLVTGGAGYIGSVVVEELLRDGHTVVVYDSLYKGHRGAVAPEAAFVWGDLLDGAALRGALRAHGVEAVVHMAADSLVGESVQDPAKYYRNNVVAGLALLEAMRECGVARLVFSSTAAVYGEPAKQPIEETDPTAPTNPYGDTKLAFERALDWYEGAYGLRYASLRYFNAAGATALNGEVHDPETHLVPLVLQAAAGRLPAVTVFGDDYPTRDGTCVRDYIHVVDLA